MAIDIGDEVDSQNGKTITQVFFLSEVCLFVNIQLNLVMLMSNGLMNFLCIRHSGYLSY